MNETEQAHLRDFKPDPDLKKKPILTPIVSKSTISKKQNYTKKVSHITLDFNNRNNNGRKSPRQISSRDYLTSKTPEEEKSTETCKAKLNKVIDYDVPSQTSSQHSLSQGVSKDRKRDALEAKLKKFTDDSQNRRKSTRPSPKSKKVNNKRFL